MRNIVATASLPHFKLIWKENLKGFGSSSFFKAIIPNINAYLIKNNCTGTLLDLGCGFGFKSVVFDKLGFEVLGIDNDTNRILKAKKHYPHIEFLHFNILNTLPYDDNSFDVIFSNSVFQYFDHDSILDECVRILKPEGHLILVENLKNNPITKCARGLRILFNYKFQTIPWNHFTYTKVKNAVLPKLENSTFKVYHLLSPISHFKWLRRTYPLFAKLDDKLLNFNFIKPFAWIVLIAGKVK